MMPRRVAASGGSSGTSRCRRRRRAPRQCSRHCWRSFNWGCGRWSRRPCAQPSARHRCHTPPVGSRAPASPMRHHRHQGSAHARHVPPPAHRRHGADRPPRTRFGRARPGRAARRARDRRRVPRRRARRVAIVTVTGTVEPDSVVEVVELLTAPAVHGGRVDAVVVGSIRTRRDDAHGRGRHRPLARDQRPRRGQRRRAPRVVRHRPGRRVLSPRPPGRTPTLVTRCLIPPARVGAVDHVASVGGGARLLAERCQTPDEPQFADVFDPAGGRPDR